MSRLPSEEFALLMLENESKGKRGNAKKDVKYKEHVCVLEEKGRWQEQNESSHIRVRTEGIFKPQFSTFPPIIQLGEL